MRLLPDIRRPLVLNFFHRCCEVLAETIKMKLPSIVTMSLMGVVSDVTGKKSDNSSGKKKVQTPEKESCSKRF